jgi:DNA modification methylase
MSQKITGADQVVMLVRRDGQWLWYDGRGEGEDAWPTPEAALADWRANPMDDGQDTGRPVWVTDATLQLRRSPAPRQGGPGVTNAMPGGRKSALTSSGGKQSQVQRDEAHPEPPALSVTTDNGILFEGGATTSNRRRRLRRDRDSDLGPRSIRLPDHHICSEHQLVRTLEAGVYHLDDIVDAAEQLGLAERANGRGKRRRGDTIYRHRVRSALDSRRRRRGDARSLGDAYWIIDGSPRRPANAVFVFLGTLSDITLALGAAADVAKRIDEPVDLIFCDPPWQLGVGAGRDSREDLDHYRRPRSALISGYEELDPGADYYKWSLEWIQPAARLLRPGGHLAVVTGPQQSAAVQMAAQHSGLTFTNSVVVPKINGVAPTRNLYATSHFRLTIMSRGDGGRGDQTFNIIPEMGTDERGRPHPRDVWPPVLPYYARGRLRYPNQLPPQFADQVIRTLSSRGNLVADFFVGSGTVPRICLFRDRRCFASDLNPNALRLTMATISDIVQSRLTAPPLFSTGPGLFPELSEPDRTLLQPRQPQGTRT